MINLNERMLPTWRQSNPQPTDNQSKAHPTEPLKPALKHLYGENVEQIIYQNILKTYGWNLQCLIRIAKPFSYSKKMFPWGYLSLPLSYVHKIV